MSSQRISSTAYAASMLTGWIIWWTIYAVGIKLVFDFGRCDSGVVYIILWNSLTIAPVYVICASVIRLSRYDNLMSHAIIGFIVSLFSYWGWSEITASIYKAEVEVFERVAILIYVAPGIIIGMLCFLLAHCLRRNSAE